MRLVSRLSRGAVVLALGVAVAEACSPAEREIELTEKAGDVGNKTLPGVCPSDLPAQGSACSLPEGTTCDFGFCGALIARCTHGVWRFGGNPPPNPPCPSEVPVNGDKCPACFLPSVKCGYDFCVVGDAGTDAARALVIASCSEGAWSVGAFSCDGGPDVQGDGGPIAD